MFGNKYKKSLFSSTKSPHRGFTLIEIMVVIAIVALLVSLVIVALKSSSAAGSRTRSVNALREMIRGYRAYSDDNRGQLMPGYIGTDLMANGEAFENLRVTLPEGTILDREDAQSYVWRLAPYVDNVWEVFFTELGDPGVEAQLQSEFASIIYSTIAQRPTYGMNSIFVGGDSEHGGTYATDRHPWTGDEDVVPLAATRFTQVKNPARLIVFGSAGKVSNGGGPDIYADTPLGFCEFRAPFLEFVDDIWDNQQWFVGAGGRINISDGNYTDPPGAGIPIIRSGQDLIPVAMLDGSAEIKKASTLATDMRRWNPFEVALRETTQVP